MPKIYAEHEIINYSQYLKIICNRNNFFFLTKEIVNKPRVVVIKFAVVYLKMRAGPPF